MIYVSGWYNAGSTLSLSSPCGVPYAMALVTIIRKNVNFVTENQCLEIVGSKSIDAIRWICITDLLI